MSSRKRRGRLRPLSLAERDAREAKRDRRADERAEAGRRLDDDTRRARLRARGFDVVQRGRP